MSLDERLRNDLSRRGSALEAETGEVHERVVKAGRRRRSVRRAIAAVGVLTVLAAAALSVQRVYQDDAGPAPDDFATGDPRPQETTAASPTATASPRPQLDFTRGEWVTFEPAPEDLPERQRNVWTGRDLIFWDRPDRVSQEPTKGFAYSPSEATWRRIAAPPIRDRSGHVLLAAGEEMLAWGGATFISAPDQADYGEPDDVFSDGASYDPSTDTWRTLPDAPVVPRYYALSLWTGAEMLVWGGRSRSGEFLNDGAIFTPATNSWRSIPAAPIEAGDGRTIIWTGKEALIFGGHTPDGMTHLTNGAAYNPETGSWRTTAEGPIERSSATLWDGDRVLMLGRSAGREAFAYYPDADRWDRLPDLPFRRWNLGAVLVDEKVYLFGGLGGDKDVPVSGIYDPDEGAWVARTPASPLPNRGGASLFWTGTEVLIWGGGNEGAFIWKAGAFRPSFG